MEDPYIGTIMMWPGHFVPEGWLPCDGRQLDVASNHALFSLLGTKFGGDGKANFRLPDLRGRVAVGTGMMQPSGPNYTCGDIGGAESVRLQPADLAPHSHGINVVSAPGTAASFAGGVLLAGAGTSAHVATAPAIYGSMISPVAMDRNSVAPSGSGAPRENCQPSLAINFIIAVTGIYPSRF